MLASDRLIEHTWGWGRLGNKTQYLWRGCYFRDLKEAKRKALCFLKGAQGESGKGKRGGCLKKMKGKDNLFSAVKMRHGCRAPLMIPHSTQQISFPSKVTRF
jgi:hypothetical protein